MTVNVPLPHCLLTQAKTTLNGHFEDGRSPNDNTKMYVQEIAFELDRNFGSVILTKIQTVIPYQHRVFLNSIYIFVAVVTII